MQVHSLVTAMLEECTHVRQELHKIPEVGFQERKTQAFLMDYIMRFEPDSVEKVADTGIKVVFYSAHPLSTIAFRADMDAISVQEKCITQYCSRHLGRMHACGHDGHMAMLMMVARMVSEHRDELCHNVVLLFQPGEEGWGGAHRMLEDKVLDNPRVDKIYGLHLWPTVPKGKIGLRWGPMMAQTSEFDLIVRGRSAHGASPQMGVDAIVAAAELISMLQTVITRSIDPHSDSLLTIGKIAGGTARNVIADEVTMNGTLRIFSLAVYNQFMHRIDEIMRGVQLATGTQIELVERMRYPCVDNPRYMIEDLYKLIAMEDVVIVEPVMAAEDFSYYQQCVPGLFLFVGINGGKNSQPLHNCMFDFDEDAMLNGIEVYRRILGVG